MTLPAILHHAFLSVMMFTVTCNIHAQSQHQIATPKIIVVSDETARELLLTAIKEELAVTGEIDAQVLDLNFPKYEDAIEELELSHDDTIIKFYKNVRRRVTQMMAALS